MRRHGIDVQRILYDYIKTLPFSSELNRVSVQETSQYFYPVTLEGETVKAAEIGSRELLQPALPYTAEDDEKEFVS